MRNAAANFDDDYGYAEPARRKAPRKATVGAKTAKGRKKKGGRRFGVDMHKVARYAAIGMSATLAIGIMVNALVLQKGHHPAPLFGKTTIGLPTAVAALAPAPSVAPTKVARDVVSEPAPVQEKVTNAPAPTAKVAPMPPSRSAEAASGEDQIARLLKGGGAGGTSDAKGDTKIVLGVQKALAKLGFTLKATGTMGPATKKAIEAFEKERSLPVHGEPSRRLAKILSAESGIKID